MQEFTLKSIVRSTLGNKPKHRDVVTQAFTELLNQARYLGYGDKRNLTKAFKFADIAHQGQKRASGQPYILHPIAVAHTLAALNINCDCLIAALLHDTIEDTKYNYDDLTEKFGEQVALMVQGLSNLKGIRYSSVDEAQAANFSRLLMAMSKDLRIILIKLADRKDNMRTLTIFNSKKQKRIARETMDIYAPLAAKIGLNEWRIELENNSFRSLYPMRHRVLSKAIDKVKGERINLVDAALQQIEQTLKKHKIKFTSITGREKRPLSIFRKMRQKEARFEQLQDLFAFRVIVNTTEDCYRTLGIMHSLFKPIAGRIKDYIALPKSNGYQSLHTVILGPHGIHAEIQIRTRSMHINAEFGISAHWKYKSNKHDLNPNAISRDWLNSLLDLHQQYSNKCDFLENAKRDLFPKEVYVFTPKGRVISLRAGSTVLDFAYAIHSKIGNHFKCAEVDFREEKINTVLTNGQVVEVFTSEKIKPQPNWLSAANTAKARSQIRAQLRTLKYEESYAAGKLQLKTHLKQVGISMSTLNKYTWQSLLDELHIASFEDLCILVARGERPASLIANQLSEISRRGSKIKSSKDETNSPIKGVEGLIVQYARCCLPVYGDPIMGHLSRHQGVMVHRFGCPNWRRMRKRPHQCVTIEWQENITIILPAHLRVITENAPDILSEVVELIGNEGMETDEAKIRKEVNSSIIDVCVFLDGRKRIADLMRSLRKLDKIKKVARVID